MISTVIIVEGVLLSCKIIRYIRLKNVKVEQNYAITTQHHNYIKLLIF